MNHYLGGSRMRHKKTWQLSKHTFRTFATRCLYITWLKMTYLSSKHFLHSDLTLGKNQSWKSLENFIKSYNWIKILNVNIITENGSMYAKYQCHCLIFSDWLSTSVVHSENAEMNIFYHLSIRVTMYVCMYVYI